MLFVRPVCAESKKNQNRFTKVLQSSAAPNRFKTVYDKKLKRNRFFKDQIIVRFKKGTKASLVSKYALVNNLELVAKLSPRVYAYKIKNASTDSLAYLADANEPTLNLLSTMGVPDEDSEITSDSVEDLDIDEYKQLDVSDEAVLRRYSKTIENFSSKEWHLDNDGQNGLVKGADINVKDAWKYTKGLGVKVAVIDTGFDLGHPDINFDSVGYDAVEDQLKALAPDRSKENHATAVAGIIAAKDDKSGVVGVAPESTIIPIRLIPEDGYVSVSNIVLAHKKAVELGAPIINNSWGSSDPTLAAGETLDLSDTEKNLYKELFEEDDVLVIFAAGNSGASNFSNSPEARSDYVLAVGSTDSADIRASYSVYGSELDIVAPGGSTGSGIVTTDRRDYVLKKGSKSKNYVVGYSAGNITTTFKGTSAAAPVVTGVAALVLSANPNLSAQELKDILVNSASKTFNSKYAFDDSGKNLEVGYGKVNAGEAVKAAMAL